MVEEFAERHERGEIDAAAETSADNVGEYPSVVLFVVARALQNGVLLPHHAELFPLVLE